MTNKGEDVVVYDDVLHTSSQERFLFSQPGKFSVNLKGIVSRSVLHQSLQ